MRKAEKIAAVALLGGLVSRWHGGGFFDTKKIVINALWALPFAFAVYVAHHGAALAWALAALVFVCTAALKATGHGGGMDLPQINKHNLQEI